jgi:peptidylamidoglycolate lyase
VKFDAAGHYEFEWGGRGAVPGKFNLPHGIAVNSRGRVYVCDRSNSRLQAFNPQGEFLSEWKNSVVGRPYGVSVASNDHVFVIDGGDQVPGVPDHAKVVELDADGKVVESFGAPGSAPGEFRLGHDIAVAPDFSVYVAEAKGQRVQKFVPHKP